MAIVYRHIRKDTNEPFYIGMGLTRKRAFEKGHRSEKWNKIAAETQYDVHILFDDVDEDFARQKEKEFIELYGRSSKGGLLVNHKIGGDGIHSVETRKKMALNRIGSVASSETKKKMSLSRRGAKNVNAKPIIDISTGIFYECILDAAWVYGLKRSTLGQYLIGSRPNKTNLRYA